MPRKTSFETVKSYYKEFEYELLVTEYKNSLYHMATKCPKGHVYKSTFNKFKVGRRCPECYKQSLRKYNIEDVKKAFALEGYKLIDDEYLDTRHYINVLCDKGHEWRTLFSRFNFGVRCNKCKPLKLSGSNAWNWNPDKEAKKAAKNFNTKKRRAIKNKALPQWAELEEIREFYKLPAILEDLTGEMYNVDHIEPLTSDLVCGLHTLANLQVITAFANQSKSNKFTPYTLSANEFPSCPLTSVIYN